MFTIIHLFYFVAYECLSLLYECLSLLHFGSCKSS